jgi:two-component system phosphate regulon sensor histidine kinase PhoR
MMRKPRLIWQIFPLYLLITILSVLVVTWFASSTLKRFYLSETANELESVARIILEQNRADFLGESPTKIDRLCKQLGIAGDIRISVIMSTGVVVGDSEEDPQHMENHSDRPEVKEALAGQRELATRYSYTLGMPMMYVAVPLSDTNEITGVVRTAIPVASIDATLGAIYRRIMLVGLVIAMLAAGVSYWISRRISRPLEELKFWAERFAKGDFSKRLPLLYSEEFNALADSMNRMAAELDLRIQTIIRQKNQEEAVLSGMDEGVLAVDLDEQVIMLNRAAARMFDIEEGGAKGKNIQEIIRHSNMHRMITETLAGEKTAEEKLTLSRGKRIVQAHGTALSDREGNRMGVLIMLQDVTHISKLERIRKDFVSNVSHELKTPITSIKGFVETLLQSSREDHGESEHFLKIIEKQTDRLNAIIEDLLTLSRIEQDAENTEITLETADIRPVLESAIDSCRLGASSRGITISLAKGDSCRAKINAPLLEQAVVNLVDNAVKYSERDGAIEVAGEVRDDETIIQVMDNGCGIADAELPRVFERFYQVDKAKSRSLGGTGLGLAIAKHIAIAHQGRISVKSSLGVGSTFTFHLPSA